MPAKKRVVKKVAPKKRVVKRRVVKKAAPKKRDHLRKAATKRAPRYVVYFVSNDKKYYYQGYARSKDTLAFEDVKHKGMAFVSPTVGIKAVSDMWAAVMSSKQPVLKTENINP